MPVYLLNKSVLADYLLAVVITAAWAYLVRYSVFRTVRTFNECRSVELPNT